MPPSLMVAQNPPPSRKSFTSDTFLMHERRAKSNNYSEKDMSRLLCSQSQTEKTNQTQKSENYHGAYFPAYLTSGL